MTAETETREVARSRLTDDGITRSIRVRRVREVYADDSVEVRRSEHGIVLTMRTRDDAAGQSPRTRDLSLTLTPDEALHVAARLKALAIVGLAGLPEQSS